MFFLLTVNLSPRALEAQVLETDTISPTEQTIQLQAPIFGFQQQFLDEEKIKQTLADSLDRSFEIQRKKDSILFAETYAELQEHIHFLSHQIDSLQEVQRVQQELIVQDSVLQLQQENLLQQQRKELQNLRSDSAKFVTMYVDLLGKNSTMSMMNDTLMKINTDFRQQLHNKTSMLEKQRQMTNEKEQMFLEKEEVYKDAISTSNVDKVKLAAQLDLKDENLKGKEVEIRYLQKNINEKETEIHRREQSLNQIVDEKNQYLRLSDTLRTALVQTEKELLKIQEELKYSQRRAREAEERVHQATNRRKKVRVIQGISLKFYRTPKWDMIPISQEGTYVNSIINRNTGWAEFDFVTGASVLLLNWADDSNRYSSDLGVYVGFGGTNLFKNFYTGASFKFLDFFYLTFGINIAEYQVLASGYKEGDVLPVGMAIQTTKEWKIKPFLSLSLDLDFLSYMGRR